MKPKMSQTLRYSEGSPVSKISTTDNVGGHRGRNPLQALVLLHVMVPDRVEIDVLPRKQSTAVQKGTCHPTALEHVCKQPRRGSRLARLYPSAPAEILRDHSTVDYACLRQRMLDPGSSPSANDHVRWTTTEYAEKALFLCLSLRQLQTQRGRNYKGG
jgi:hypothetical protein